MTLPFKEHPLRHQGVAELHARTYEPLTAPARVSHVAMLCGEKGSGRNQTHLNKLLAHYGLPQPATLDQHYFARLGDIQMRWERHTEFVTYTFSKVGAYDHPFEPPVLAELPPDWLRELPGEAVTVVALALDAATQPERSAEELSALFAENTLIGSEVVGGAARAWSDLRIHPDGVSRMLLRDQGLSPNQAGRLVKRFLEINAYRAMAILGLPEAREANLTLAQADRRLVGVAARMTDEALGQGVPDAELLAELTTLAAEIEAVAARTSSRFEGSRAYYSVVVQRLDQLRQKRIEGLQTFSEFLDARLAPAIATCSSTAKRQQGLAERAARLTSLLRARVEVRLQEQNRGLLESMNRRAQLQLRLQETVEGLSVIAIGYYGVGLIGYLLKGLEAHGAQIHATYATGLMAPVIVGLAWLGIRRMKERLLNDDLNDD